nr:CotO family spore coat protein [Fredinandcohnia onubensis]
MNRKNVPSVKQKPLIYVYQPPTLNQPIKMQSTYVIRGVSQREVLDEVPAEVNEVAVPKEKATENVEIEPPERKHEVLEEPAPSINKRKRFKDMKIDEKIYYLTNLPRNIPSFICEIVGKGKVLQGVIVFSNEEIVTVRTNIDGQKEEIKIEDIENINIIGF